MIQRQQYVQIKEWVIVEGSQEEILRDKNIVNINEFINEKMDKTDIEMRFIVPESIVSLSNLRNIGNDNCKGDIIVFMNDDDYYPPTQVPNAVKG
jgi:glycosyltransferase involved in cell wall biosynthesis